MNSYHERAQIKRWALYNVKGELITETGDYMQHLHLVDLYTVGHIGPIVRVFDGNQTTPQHLES